LGFFSGRNCNSSQQREYDVRLTKGRKRKKEKRRTYPTIFFGLLSSKVFVWALSSSCRETAKNATIKKSKQTASVLELAVAAQLMSLATSLRTLNPAATATTK
jgi:hypothetical protein